MLPKQDAFLEDLFRKCVNDLILYATATLGDGTRAKDVKIREVIFFIIFLLYIFLAHNGCGQIFP